MISNTETMYMEIHCPLVRNHMEFYFGTIMYCVSTCARIILTHFGFKVAADFRALLTHHIIVRTLVAEDEVFATRKTHKLYENPARLRKDGSNRRKYYSCVFVQTRALTASVITSD